MTKEKLSTVCGDNPVGKEGVGPPSTRTGKRSDRFAYEIGNLQHDSWTRGHVYLKAHCPERHVARFYRIRVDRNLFGDVVIRANYGRIGTQGQLKEWAFTDDHAVATWLRRLLRKRLNAVSRIGVNYAVVKSLQPKSET